MGIKDEFYKWQADPRFAKFSYQEQVSLRVEWLLRKLGTDSSFQALSTEDKDKFLREQAYAPPVFENWQVGDQYLKAAQAAIAQKAAGVTLPASSPNNALTNALALIAQEERRPMLSFREGIAKPIVRGISGVLGLPVNDPQEEAIVGKDRRKGAEYLGYVLSTDLQRSNQVSTMKALGTGIGFVEDLLTYYGMTGFGGPTRAIARGAQALAAGRGIAALARSAPVLGRTLQVGLEAGSRFIPQATGEGIVGVIRDNLLRVQRGEPTSFQKEKPFADMVKVFGEYAALDFGIGLAVQTGTRALASLMKVLTVGYGQGGVIQELTRAAKAGARGADTVEEIAGAWLRGDLVDDATLQRLPEIQREHMLNAKVVIDNLRNRGLETAMDPVIKTRLAAFNLWLVPTITEDGTWVFRKLYPGAEGFQPVVRKGLTEANAYMAQTMQDMTSGMTDGQIAQWRASKFWVEPFGALPRYVDDITDTRKLTMDIPEAQKDWITAIRSSTYRAPVDRPVIDSTEAVLFMGTARREAAFVGLMEYGVSPEVDKKIIAAMKGKGTAVFDDGVPLVLRRNPEPSKNNALVMLRNPATHDQWEAAKVVAQRQIVEGHLPYDEADLTRYNLISSGRDGVVHPDGSVETFFPSRVKLIDDRLNPVTGKFSLAVTHGVTKGTSSMGTKAEVFLTLEGALPAGEKVKAGAIAAALGPIGGTLKRDELLEFARTYFRAQGVEPEKFNIIVDPKLVDRPELFAPTGTAGIQILKIPEKINTPAARQEFVRSFTNQLQAMAEVWKANKAGTEITLAGLQKELIGGKVVKSYEKRFDRFKMPVVSDVDQRAWLSHIVAQNEGKVDFTSQGVVVTGKGGQPRTFTSVEEAADRVLLDHTTEKELQLTMQDQGFFVRRKKVGQDVVFQVVQPNGKPVAGWEGRTPGEVLERTGIRPKLDGDRYGPQFVMLDPNLRTFQYKGGSMIGGRKAVLQMLDQFTSFKERTLERIVNVGDGSVVRKVSAQIEVHIPQAGIRKTFSTTDEALAFVKGDWRRYDKLLGSARHKGLDLSFRDGTYLLQAPGGEKHVARNFEELATVLKGYPDPDYLPRLEKMVGAPDSAIELIDSLKLGAVPDPTPPVVNHPPIPKKFKPARVRKLGQMVMPRRDFLDGALRKIDHKDLAAQVLDVDAAHTVWRNDAALGERIADAEHVTSNGKPLALEREILVSQYMEQVPEARGKFIETTGMTPDEVIVAERDEVFYDEMFARVGLDSRVFLQKYLPHIRDKLFQMGPEDAQIHVMADDLMESIWGKGKVPNEVKWWAEYERTSDIVLDVFDRNALSLRKRYLTSGLRKFYLDPTFRKLAQAVHDGSLPSEISDNLELWRKQLMGVDDSYAENLMKSGLEGFVRKLQESGETGLTAKDIAKLKRSSVSIMNKLYSLSYMSSLGWRPWTAIRNMFQVFTHGATRFGLADTVQAVNDVADMGEDVFSKLRAKGLISDVPPQMDAFLQRESLLGRATSSSMAQLKNTDDWSRIVGWRLAERKWDRAIRTFLTNRPAGSPFEMEKFLKSVDADLLGEGVQVKVATLMRQNKMDAALDVYARELINDAFFPYRQTQKPLAFRGLVGRAFGQFGVFATNHVQHLWKGLTRGGPAKITAFALRTAAISGALYYGFRAMGIDEDDFLPWVPLSFSGGPMSSLFLTALKAISGRGYEARQARGELDRYFPFDLATFLGAYQARFKDIVEGNETAGPGPSFQELMKSIHLPMGFTPGYFEILSIKKALDYADKGDLYRAALSLGGAPLVPGGE